MNLQSIDIGTDMYRLVGGHQQDGCQDTSTVNIYLHEFTTGMQPVAEITQNLI